MKKILIIVLFIIFFIGVYMNFGMGNPIDKLSFTSSNSDDEIENTENSSEDETADNNEGETASETEEDSEQPLVFSQPALNEKLEAAESNNEPLILDILLPSYYSDDFTERLTNAFDSSLIQFNRQDLNVNTTDLNEVSISDNSDGVIIDALQVQDYNDEVLFERDDDSLEDVYMSIFNDDRVAYILGNPNVHEHENLSDTLSRDAEYFSDNDYYYINNQDIEVDNDYDYDTDSLSSSVEDQIIQSIHDYLVE